MNHLLFASLVLFSASLVAAEKDICAGKKVGHRFCPKVGGVGIATCLEGGDVDAQNCGFIRTDFGDEFQGYCFPDVDEGAKCEPMAQSGDCKDKRQGDYCTAGNAYLSCPDGNTVTCASITKPNGIRLLGRCMGKGPEQAFASCESVFFRGACRGRTIGEHCLSLSTKLSCNEDGTAVSSRCWGCISQSEGKVRCVFNRTPQ